MTAEELRRHLKLDELVAAGYTVTILSADVQSIDPGAPSIDPAT